MAPQTRNQAAREISSLGKRSHSVLEGPLATEETESEEQPSKRKRDSLGNLQRSKAKEKEEETEEDGNTSSPREGSQKSLSDLSATEEQFVAEVADNSPSPGEKLQQNLSDLPATEEQSDSSDIDFNDWITVPLNGEEEEKVAQPPTTNPQQAPGSQWMIAPVAPMAHVQVVQELLRASRFLQDLDSARESVRKASRETSFGSVDIIAPGPSFQLHDSFLDMSEPELSSSESDEASMTSPQETRPFTAKEDVSPKPLSCGIESLLKNPELHENPTPPIPPTKTKNASQKPNGREPAPSEQYARAAHASGTAEIAIRSRQPAPTVLPDSDLQAMSSAGLHWLAHRVQIELGRRLIRVGGEKDRDIEESEKSEEDPEGRGSEENEEDEEGENGDYSVLDQID